jgi:protein-S-isoprenylcysteine O-methyltransferase Ste14
MAVWAGAWGVLHGLGDDGGGSVNHERYLSGLLLAIGLAFWTTVSDIEGKTARFRLLTALVVIGGISRLLGVALGDTPSWLIGGALAMELLVAPLLCLWQGRVGPATVLARV